MRQYFPFLLLALAAVVSPVQAAADTAREALRVVSKLGQPVQVFGERGMDQPPFWRVLVRAPDTTIREFHVARGRVVAEVIVPRTAVGVSTAPLPMHRLNIDSTAAFRKAEQAAIEAKVGFDSMNYELRCLELSTNAAWFLVLLDSKGRKVGDVTVGASTGNVIRKAFYRYPVTPPPPPGSTAETAWNRTRAGITNAAEGVKRGVGRATGWIRRKVTRN